MEGAKGFIRLKDKELNGDLADSYEKTNKLFWRNYESFVRENKVNFFIEEVELELYSESFSGGV